MEKAWKATLWRQINERNKKNFQIHERGIKRDLLFRSCVTPLEGNMYQFSSFSNHPVHFVLLYLTTKETGRRFDTVMYRSSMAFRFSVQYFNGDRIYCTNMYRIQGFLDFPVHVPCRGIFCLLKMYHDFHVFFSTVHFCFFSLGGTFLFYRFSFRHRRHLSFRHLS